jgi:hypothetical protein
MLHEQKLEVGDIMLRLNIFKMIFLVMLFAFTLNATGVTAQDKCFVPTLTKEVNFPLGWHDFFETEHPVICAADGKQLGYGSVCDEVAREACVTVYIGGQGGESEYAPYSWAISGTGFHFDAVDGPTTWESASSAESVLICADNTACGKGIVTVTDSCWNTGIDFIKCTTGQWDPCACFRQKSTHCYYSQCCTIYRGGHKLQICTCSQGGGGKWPCITGECGDGFVYEVCYDNLPDDCGISSQAGIWLFAIYPWICD